MKFQLIIKNHNFVNTWIKKTQNVNSSKSIMNLWSLNWKLTEKPTFNRWNRWGKSSEKKEDSSFKIDEGGKFIYSLIHSFIDSVSQKKEANKFDAVNGKESSYLNLFLPFSWIISSPMKVCALHCIYNSNALNLETLALGLCTLYTCLLILLLYIFHCWSGVLRHCTRNERTNDRQMVECSLGSNLNTGNSLIITHGFMVHCN